MKMFGYCLDRFVIVLFGMVWRMVPEWCLSHSSHLQVLPLSGRNTNYGFEPSRGETLATEFGSSLPLSGGYLDLGAMLSRSHCG